MNEHLAKIDIADFAHLMADQASRLGAVSALAGQRIGMGQADNLKREIARLRALLEEIERVARDDPWNNKEPGGAS